MESAPSPPPGPAGVTPAPPVPPSRLPDEIEPDRRWTLVYGAGLPPELGNPNQRGRGWNEATALIYSRLFHVGPRGVIEPDLVAKHLVLDDGLTWQIRIRNDVTWHDGTPLTLKDVEATLDGILSPGSSSDLGLNLPMIESVTYPGSHTLRIRLNHPAPLLPVPLSEIAILPAGDQTGSSFNGTGPYRYVKHRDNGSLEFHAHAGYHLGSPSIPRILLKPVPDDRQRARAVAGHDVDLAHVKAQHAYRLWRRNDVQVVKMASGSWRGMPLNLRRPHLKDRRVRRAIDLALDRRQIVVNALPGTGLPAYQPVPPTSWAFSRELDSSYHDPNAAMELLEQAGWFAGTDGLRYRGRDPKVDVALASRSTAPGSEDEPLTLRLIIWKDEAFRKRAGQMIRQQLRRVGIRVRLKMVDNAAYGQLAENMGDEYDGFIGGWGSLLDPGDNLYKKFHSEGSQNYMGYRSAAVDRMLEACRRTTDPEMAAGMYRRLMEHLREEAVFLPLAYPEYLFAAGERVAGFSQPVTESWYEFTRHAWRWKLDPD